MLNTENQNCFTYATEELLFELLGGVRIDTLDRMRVTVKVSVVKRKHPQYIGELADLAVRHNLDLYNDTQVDKFVRTVAEKLEVVQNPILQTTPNRFSRYSLNRSKVTIAERSKLTMLCA